jgi:alkylation response protein AidB-like acyl-CoA dehydrogenase
MFVVDLSSPGVEVRPIVAANGSDEFGEVFFDGVRVGADALVGEVNDGWGVAMYLLQWERGMYAWQRQSVLHLRLSGALQGRKDWPLEAAALLGSAYMNVLALRSRSAKTLKRLATGEMLGAEISIDKLLLIQAEHAVADLERAISGFDFVMSDEAEADVLRSEYFFSRATSILGGSQEVQKNIVAERLLGMPKEPLVAR